jgi:branched-chain amino acid aminotransferase/4-amino-4-deoxychorismate lyase
MIINFNGEFIQEEDIALNISTNRCFLYGDGVFESMLGSEKGIRFWEDHYDRLVKSSSAIRLDIQRLPGSQNLHELLKQVIVRNNIQGAARMKVQIWRTARGLYNPDADDISYIITGQPYTQSFVQVKERVKVIYSPRLTFTEYSSFKTCNSLPYVLASKERALLNLDDVLLLDQKNRIAEFSSMNIFWFQKGKLFTPSLNTGCIAGVMRKKILDFCAHNRIKTMPALSTVDELRESDFVFGSNFSGIHAVSRINEWKFHSHLPDFILAFIEKEIHP